MSPLSFVVPMDGSPFYQTGKRILQAMEGAGVDQHDAVQWMGAKLDISETKAADYIRGEARLSKVIADKLAMNLGVRSEWLRVGTGERKPGLGRRQRPSAQAPLSVGAPTVRTGRGVGMDAGESGVASIAVADIPGSSRQDLGSACVRCQASSAQAGSAVCTPCAHAYAAEAALVAATERRQVQYLQLQLSNAQARVQEIEGIAVGLINKIAGHAAHVGLLSPVRPVDPDLAHLLLDNMASKINQIS